MEKGFFIQSNKKQILGAYLAKYAFEKTYGGKEKISTTIMLAEDIPIFQTFIGKTFKRGGREVIYDKEDLQSFTLTRFLPPQLMGFVGRAVVIDPDIFALKDISPLFEMNLEGNALAACGKKNAWDSSVMVLDCQKLKHWDVEHWLSELSEKKIDYETIMTLKSEGQVLPLGREWNDLDHIDQNTKMLHTTRRLTQPWKTHLPIDFTRAPMPKLFGIIPRELVHRLIGKYPTHYAPHPDKHIEQLFLQLVKNALLDGAITKDFLQEEIDLKHVRGDLFEALKVI